jgi:hypothetical protein
MPATPEQAAYVRGLLAHPAVIVSSDAIAFDFEGMVALLTAVQGHYHESPHARAIFNWIEGPAEVH